MKTPKKLLATILALSLASSMMLTGCGSLSRILAEPDPPREETTEVELTHVLRAGETYKDIEIFHGTEDEPYYSPDKKGYLYEQNGWIYLHIEGEPDKRGYQHGWLLADYIQLQIDLNKDMLAELYAIDWQYLKTNAQRMWEEQVSDEYRTELDGIVAGAKERGATFDYIDLLVINGLEELRDCWFPTVQKDYYAELAAGLWKPRGASVEVTAQVPAEDEESTDENAEGQEEATDNKDTEDTPEETNAEASGADAEADSGSASEEGSTTDRSNENDAKEEDSASGTQDEERIDQNSPSTSGDSKEEDDAKDTDKDATEEEKETDSDADSNIGVLPYSESVKLTGLYGSDSIKEFTQPGSVYTKQAVAVLATGSATEDGNIILVQNTIAAYADSNFSNVMIEVDPQQGERFTMQAAPGFIHSVGEAYSTTKLLVANTRISGFNVYSEAGTPEFLRIRQAVQYAQNLNDFTNAMVEGANGGLASSWLVGDLETNQIMELELGAAFYNVQKITDGCFISFGGVDDTRILNYETDGSGFTDLRLGTGARYTRLMDLLELNEKLTTETAQQMISDHTDVYLGKSRASSRSICAHYDVDDAEYAVGSEVEPYMPYGTVDAKVMSSDLAEDNTILARWGCACGKAFDSIGFLEKNQQYLTLQEYLFDRPSESWSKLNPLDA